MLFPMGENSCYSQWKTGPDTPSNSKEYTVPQRTNTRENGYEKDTIYSCIPLALQSTTAGGSQTQRGQFREEFSFFSSAMESCIICIRLQGKATEITTTVKKKSSQGFAGPFYKQLKTRYPLILLPCIQTVNAEGCKYMAAHSQQTGWFLTAVFCLTSSLNVCF